MDFEVEEALEVADSIEMIDLQLTETDFDLDIYTGDEYHTNLRMQDTNEGFEVANIQTQDEVEKMTPEPQRFSVFLPTSDPTPLAPQMPTTILVRPAPSNSRSEREPPPEPTSTTPAGSSLARNPLDTPDGTNRVRFAVPESTESPRPIYLGATKACLMERYEMRDLGELRWFLELRILRDRLQRKVWICQDAYVDKIAHKFGIKANARVTTPLSQSPSELGKGPEPSKNAGPSERFRHLYQQKMYSLIYPAIITRPDIAASVSLLASQVQNPSEIHMEEADRVITYLKNTWTLAIEYNG
ncbi:hypothetical protein VTO42DRAFT_2638 [Malbranchea cinnamomea]